MPVYQRNLLSLQIEIKNPSPTKLVKIVIFLSHKSPLKESSLKKYNFPIGWENLSP